MKNISLLPIKTWKYKQFHRSMRGQKLSQLKDAMYSILRDMREGNNYFLFFNCCLFNRGEDKNPKYFLLGVRIWGREKYLFCNLLNCFLIMRGDDVIFLFNGGEDKKPNYFLLGVRIWSIWSSSTTESDPQRQSTQPWEVKNMP